MSRKKEINWLHCRRIFSGGKVWDYNVAGTVREGKDEFSRNDSFLQIMLIIN
jgi:hypothetical protein